VDGIEALLVERLTASAELVHASPPRRHGIVGVEGA
jgi:hypothetical protein